MTVPLPHELELEWSLGHHKKVAKFLPYYKTTSTGFLGNLNNSNLLTLGSKINLPPLTLGADPEFILKESGTDNVVMFSSKYVDNRFGLSEAEIGADYGLLEFRLPYATTPEQLVATNLSFHDTFKQSFPKLDILEAEAVKYNHSKARLREDIEQIKKGEQLFAYGGYHGKECAVWGANTDPNKITITGETTFCAYDKPQFKKYNPEILSAGGHIHIGGTFIKSLSLPQLRKLIKIFDAKLVPIAKTVYTEASELREQVYGALGEYRIKDYGIEYRTLSNAIFWKKNSTTLLKILKVIESEIKEFMNV